ncbi:hypothetical protein G6F68_011699 [Rhizopus microsporus]|nr:hypothetical protein G6F68_011699 [Rhizopus microsporus]
MHGAEVAVAARQQRGRAGIGEALPRRAIRRALAAHAGDKQRLLEIMAVDLDPQRPAHGTGGAIGTDHQPGQQHVFAALIGHPHLAIAIAHLAQPQETHRPVTAQPRQLLQPSLQRLAEIARDHHLAEPGPVIVTGVKLHAAEITGAADMDAADRSRRHRQLLHHAQRSQRVDGGRGETEVALVEHRRQFTGGTGLEQAYVAAQALQGNGQAGADQAASDDQHVMSFTHAFMIRARPDCTPNGTTPAPSRAAG